MNDTYELTDLMIWNGIDNAFQPGRLTIRDGHIADSLSGRTARLSMKGGWAVPGFTDSHVHLVNYALAGSYLILDRMALEDIQRVLRITSAATPPGRWIRGRGWEAACRVQGGFPDRDEIDPITSDHPVVLSSKDGHTAWLNSIALKELDLDKTVQDPPGGRFDRRDDGELTGIIRENAVDMVRTKIPAIPDSVKKNLLLKAIHQLHKQGIVAVHSFESIAEISLLRDLAEDNALDLKVMAFFSMKDLEKVRSAGLRYGDKKGSLLIGGQKLFADGALGSRTAAVSQPYSHEDSNFGIDVMHLQELTEAAHTAAAYGYPTAIHAIGDRAVRHALQALISAQHQFPIVNNHRIEHLQLIDQMDLVQIRAHDIIASVQPCHMISDIEMAERFWNRQTALRYPYGSLIGSGIRVLFGSDAPIDNENPLHNIDAAVTRRRRTGRWSCEGWHSEECVPIQDAFRAATVIPGSVEPGGRQRGFLLPGSPADIVILNQNPFETGIRPGDNTIEAVFCDGKRVA